MKPVAALVAITLLLWAGPLMAVVAPPPAAASGAPPPDVAGAPLRLTLTQLAPRLVRAGGPDTLTIAGTLTNTGAEPIEDLVIRVQRGDPLATEGELRDALDGTAGTDAVTPQFTPLTAELAPGGEIPVQLSVPLRGAPTTSLALAEPGVYEVLVNVNGAPRDGPTARLAAVRLLLPVLSLSGGAAGEGAPATAPTPFSLLYPITDTPRRHSTVPGEPTLLSDDGLASSFAPGGRLDGLLTAYTEAAPAGSRVRDATCLAVDPDLVETAAAMSSDAGYSYLGPAGAPVPGTGADAARRWLAGLTAAADGGCVVALPYADADLVALTRGGLGELATGAITGGREVLTALLGTPVVPHVTWPAAGVADEQALAGIARADGRAVLLSADGVEQGRVPLSRGVVPLVGGQQFAVLTDPLLTSAATGAGTTGDTGPGSAVAASSPAGTTSPLATQDAIGTLVFRATGGGAASGAPLVLAPPHGWATEGAAARELLTSVDRLLDDDVLLPVGLDTVLAAGPRAGTGAVSPAYPLDAGGSEVPTAVVDTVRATAGDVADLRSSAVPDSPVGLEPDEVFTPLERGLVRPASAAWRGRPDAAARAAQSGSQRISDLRATVRVLEPPGPYSLGTTDAPILITVANGLPVTMQVHVEIAPTSGLRVAPIETQEVPPGGRRQVRVSAEVTRSGQFTVRASVRTLAGEQLGPASRLRVRSTAYGTITVWLTGSAGVLLVVLAVRRVVRRIRGEPTRQPASAPPGPPDPSPTAVPHPDPTPAPHERPTPGSNHRPTAGDPFPEPASGVRPPHPATGDPAPRPDGPPRPPAPPRVPSP